MHEVIYDFLVVHTVASQKNWVTSQKVYTFSTDPHEVYTGKFYVLDNSANDHQHLTN